MVLLSHDPVFHQASELGCQARQGGTMQASLVDVIQVNSIHSIRPLLRGLNLKLHLHILVRVRQLRPGAWIALHTKVDSEDHTLHLETSLHGNPLHQFRDDSHGIHLHCAGSREGIVASHADSAFREHRQWSGRCSPYLSREERRQGRSHKSRWKGTARRQTKARMRVESPVHQARTCA